MRCDCKIYGVVLIRLGNFDDAKSILTKFDKACPGLAAIQMRRLGVERRTAVYTARKREESTPDYSDLCRRYEILIHDDQMAPRVASTFAMKFARFQSKVRKLSVMTMHLKGLERPGGLDLDGLEASRGRRAFDIFRDTPIPSHALTVRSFWSFQIRRDNRLAEKVLLDALDRDKVS